METNISQATARSAGFNWGDFFSFKTLITLKFIQIIYIIVAIFITLTSLVMMFGSSLMPFGGGFMAGGVLMGLLYLIVGNLLWRIWCEIIIIFFRMNKTLGEINEKTSIPLDVGKS